MSADDTRLAAAQATLVAALTAGQAVPAHFDEGRVVAMSAVLRDKRRRAVAKRCPALRRALGVELDARFNEYAQATLLGADTTDDALRFITWLSQRGITSRELRVARRRLWLRRMMRLVGP